jgi:hypothetical protein
MSIFTSPKKSVETIVSAFNTAISDLNDVACREIAEAQRQEEAAIAAREAAVTARTEASRAQAVSEKLRALIAA